jgi:hypothetical protein
LPPSAINPSAPYLPALLEASSLASAFLNRTIKFIEKNLRAKKIIKIFFKGKLSSLNRCLKKWSGKRPDKKFWNREGEKRSFFPIGQTSCFAGKMPGFLED